MRKAWIHISSQQFRFRSWFKSVGISRVTKIWNGSEKWLFTHTQWKQFSSSFEKKLFHDSKSERISLHGFNWFKYAYKNNHKYRKISIIFQLYIHLYNNRCLVWSVCFVLTVVFFSIWPLSIYYLLGAESECNEPWQSSYTYSFTL